MADIPDIQKLISTDKVKDTVEKAKSLQDQALSMIQSKATEFQGLMGGMASAMSNAKNVISQSISGITSKLTDSIASFSQNVNTGLTTTLTDLSKKHGSMMSDVLGKINTGAIAEKLAFTVNTADASINGLSLFGGSGAADSLLSSFTSGGLDKLVSASGLSAITNNSTLSSAINSISNSIGNLTSGAKSIISDVMNMDPIKSVTKLVSSNETLNKMVNSVSSAVSELSNKIGLGDVQTLAKDLYSIYNCGKTAYAAVTSLTGGAVPGISSTFNSSYSTTTNLLNLANDLCSTINSNGLLNYSQNKDLFDLLLQRCMNNGMHGAVSQLMNCTDTAKYVDERTMSVLTNTLSSLTQSGDVQTVNAVYNIVGNGRIANATGMMTTLASNMEDSTENVTTYMNMLNGLGLSGNDIVGREYSGGYAYDTSLLNSLSSTKNNTATALVGGNSDVLDMASSISKMWL